MENEQMHDLLSILRQNDSGKVKKYCVQLASSTETVSFQDFISGKMSDGGYTREDLALLLGYSGQDIIRKKAETLKKTINTVGYTTNRDRIVAICIALSLTLKETNTALCLYDMLPLDEYDDRDRIIIAAVYSHEDFTTLNHWLSLAGKQTLSIEKTVRVKAPRVVRQPKNRFKIINQPIAACGDFVGEKSLYGMYNPNTYMCKAEMTVQATDGTIYELSAEDNGSYEIWTHKKNMLPEPEILHSLDECMNNEFKDYFLSLEDCARRKVQDVMRILNDTRNYITRVDAAFSVDSLVFFAETFNYDDPESSEYFQMEYHDGTYLMYTSHHSVFLERHLGKHYETYFAKNKVDQPVAVSYPPAIDNNASKATVRQNEKKTKMYLRLKEAIDDMVTQMKNGTMPVYDPYSILDDLYYDLAGIYGLREKFTWTPEEEGPYMIPAEDSCDVNTSDGNCFTVTFSDMRRAFELAIPSTDAMYQVIQKHGSIDNLIP